MVVSVHSHSPDSSSQLMNQCESLSTRLGATNLVGAPGRRMDEEYDYDVNLIKCRFNSSFSWVEGTSSLIVEGMDCPMIKKLQ